MARRWLVTGALLGALAVVAAALGAHGLEDRLDAEAMAWWETAAHHHLLHAVVVLVCGVLGGAIAAWRWAPRLLVAGIAIFSGTLYGLALGGPSWLGAITPVGGTLLIAGWVAIAWGARRAGPAA